MNRFVVYSDLHLHCWSYGAESGSGYNSRLISQIRVLNQIKEYCLSRHIDTLVFTGDCFHTQGKVDSEVLMAAYNAFKEISDRDIHQIWLVGNHDAKNKAGTIHSLQFLKSFGTVVDDMELVRDFWCMAYTEDEEKLKRFFELAPENCIALMHQGVAGVPMKSGYLIDEIFKPEMVPSKVRFVFTGHYHKAKLVNNKILIPGSAMQHTWNDAGDKRGWWDVQVHGSQISLNHIESNHPKFILNPNEATDMDFVKPKADTEEKEINLSSADFDCLDELIEEFSEQKELDPYSQLIGKQLRANTYEAPRT